jgi:hypothetical protein
MGNSHVESINGACRCCGGVTTFFSSAVVLTHHAIYTKCTDCQSVQVESPFWIVDAHAKAISQLDTGLVARCLSVSRLVGVLLLLEKKRTGNGFDWGGGTGLLTRLLRDQGYQVLSHDKYADGIHAEGFIASDSQIRGNGTFVTAIECFEHLTDPIGEFSNLVSNKEYFIFTTELIGSPPPNPANQEWWYYMPASGQHITFATSEGINSFKKIIGFDHYVRVGNLHILSRLKLKFLTRVVLRFKISRSLAILVIPEILNRRFALTFIDKDQLEKL